MYMLVRTEGQTKRWLYALPSGNIISIAIVHKSIQNMFFLCKANLTWSQFIRLLLWQIIFSMNEHSSMGQSTYMYASRKFILKMLYLDMKFRRKNLHLLLHLCHYCTSKHTLWLCTRSAYLRSNGHINCTSGDLLSSKAHLAGISRRDSKQCVP